MIIKTFSELKKISYELIHENFQQTRVLNWEQLEYLLSSYEIIDYLDFRDDLKNWHSHFIHLKYIQDLIDQFSTKEFENDQLIEIFLITAPYYKTIRHSYIELPQTIEAQYFQLHLEIMAHQANQVWNYNQPFSSFFYQFKNNATRISCVHSSLNPNQQPSAFIRLIPQNVYPLQSYISKSLQKEETEEKEKSLNHHLFLDLIKKKKNLLIAGATGSGKTSFLSTLISYTPENQHLICIEDTKELITHSSTTQMLADVGSGKEMKDLCQYALRMSPDRVVLGEMRSHEIIPFFLMMNTGHRGLMSTIHSNSAIEAVHRCAFLFSLYSQGDYINYEQALKMISQNIDYVIFLEKRKIKEVIKVLGSEKADCYYEAVSLESRDLTRDFFIRDSLRNQSIYT